MRRSGSLCTQMHFIAIVGLVFAGLSSVHAESSGHLRIGIVVPHAERAVLAAEGAPVRAGTKAYPVPLSAAPPFSVREPIPTPAGTPPGPLVLVAGSPVPVYATDLPDGVALDLLPMVVTLGQEPPSGLAVSSCTSAEGIHVSLWSGEGLQRTRRWSAYVHLGYYTEPTCSDSELASERRGR